ncbi:hypothetical protein GC197_04970 [bacterium]|nr:hypothetical protein [bacterium]
MKHAAIGITFLLLIGFTVTEAAAQWGTVHGKFVVDGKVEPLPPLKVSKDQQFCGNELKDPSLELGENGELQDVALWLYLSRGEKTPEAHSSYAEAAKKPVVIKANACAIEPFVALAVAGQKVEFADQDRVPYNIHVQGFSNLAPGWLMPPGGNLVLTFQEERWPMNVSCTIHPWMKAHIVVKKSPYMAVSDENGEFTIENLPVGKHKLQLWHHQLGTIQEMKLGGQDLEAPKGIIQVDVQPGQNDLGTIHLPGKLF